MRTQHGNILRDMPTSGGTSHYTLGNTDAERERLIRQAMILAPLTERFFRHAGIEPGQRLLDLGSGVGDVAMLAARLVCPSGKVIGAERDSRSVARAITRAAEAGLNNVEFTQSDVRQLPVDQPFDVVVGRFILQFLPDPVVGLRFISQLVRPGGVVRLSRAMLESHSSTGRELAFLVCMRISDSRVSRTLGREYRDGAYSPPSIRASGLAPTNSADGNSGGR